MCGQVLDVNMVSEPKAHVTKGKAIKRQTEKGEVDQQVMANQPLLAYYMNSMVGGAGDTVILVTLHSDVTLACIANLFLFKECD